MLLYVPAYCCTVLLPPTVHTGISSTEQHGYRNPPQPSSPSRCAPPAPPVVIRSSVPTATLRVLCGAARYRLTSPSARSSGSSNPATSKLLLRLYIRLPRPLHLSPRLRTLLAYLSRRNLDLVGLFCLSCPAPHLVRSRSPPPSLPPTSFAPVPENSPSESLFPSLFQFVHYHTLREPYLPRIMLGSG